MKANIQTRPLTPYFLRMTYQKPGEPTPMTTISRHATEAEAEAAKGTQAHYAGKYGFAFLKAEIEYNVAAAEIYRNALVAKYGR